MVLTLAFASPYTAEANQAFPTFLCSPGFVAM